MSRFARGVRVTLVISIIALVAVYLLLGCYYSDGFSYGTWFNGVYCTGKSVEEVNEILKEGVTLNSLTVEDQSGAQLVIDPEDIDLSYDYTESLNVRMQNQNALTWGLYLFSAYRSNIVPTITFNYDKLYEIIANWEIFTDESVLNVDIGFDENGYYLINEKESVPVLENILYDVSGAIYKENTYLKLTDSEDNYESVSLNTSEQEVFDFFHHIDELQNTGLSLNIMDETVEVNSDVTWKFLVTDRNFEELSSKKSTKKQPWLGKFICNGQEVSAPEEYEVSHGFITDADGNIYVSEEEIYNFALSLMDKYDTGYTVDKYKEDGTTEIIIADEDDGNPGIIKGDEIYAFIVDYYMGSDLYDSDVLNVAIRDDVTVHDGSELGDTYIEVDMGAQTLTYFVDGEINMQFPVVTGNTNRGRGTPSGIYNIYNKRHDTILRGENYASFVHYWLGVYKGVGIHDANWRDEFGGEIYKNDGSHGCINCPSDMAEILWNIVEIGTPALLYY